jgi:hypothetical protein
VMWLVVDKEGSSSKAVMVPALHGAPSTRYELLAPPVDLERRWRSLLRFSEAESYVSWLSQVERGRARAAWSFFQQVGLETNQDDDLIALGTFVQSWYPEAMAPYAQPQEPPVIPMIPSDPNPRSGIGAAIEASLAHDIGFILASEVQRVHPSLVWGVTGGGTDEMPMYGVSLPAPNGADLIDLARTLLRTSLYQKAAPEYFQSGSYDAREPRWWATWLRRTVDNLVAELGSVSAGKGIPREVEPLLWKSPFSPRVTPPRADTPAPYELLEAVAAYRENGFFADTQGSSPTELARALGETFLQVTGGSIPLTSPDLDQALLDLDVERTIVFDIEADVAAGNRAYESVVYALGAISGGFLRVLSVREDWSVRPEVSVNVELEQRSFALTLHERGDYVDAAVVLELNELMPGEAGKFWFYDAGPQEAHIVRATSTERRWLAQRRDTQLLEEPPGWWSSSSSRFTRPE